MKKINEEILLSTGNATSLMVFVELGHVIEKQRGMLQIAFPNLGQKGIFRILSGFRSNPIYAENKDAMIGMSERFHNDGPLKALYKTLAFLVSKETKPEEADGRMQDINRVFSKIERMINSKLTDEEKELFSSIEDTLDDYGDALNSKVNSSIESSSTSGEEAAEKEPEEKSDEKPKEEPKPEEPKPEEPKPEESKPEEKSTDKPKTEEQFRSLIKRLVKETLRDYEKKFGKL